MSNIVKKKKKSCANTAPGVKLTTPPLQRPICLLDLHNQWHHGLLHHRQLYGVSLSQKNFVPFILTLKNRHFFICVSYILKSFIFSKIT